LTEVKTLIDANNKTKDGIILIGKSNIVNCKHGAMQQIFISGSHYEGSACRLRSLCHVAAYQC
jgi:hypothetical protein